MADDQTTSRLKSFMDSGIYRFDSPNVVFMDPVRVLNRSYNRFRVSPSAYYPRFFDSDPPAVGNGPDSNPKKRKRKAKRKEEKTRALNERELAADNRHQKVRPLLAKAHESLMEDTAPLKVMRGLRNGGVSGGRIKGPGETSLVELGRVWQAPLCEITLKFPPRGDEPNDEGGEGGGERRAVPLFNSLVDNETSQDVEAEIFDRGYVIPRESCFYMSDLSQIQGIVPAGSDCGFNLIMIDPPWENASARQKVMYETLPNRYFLSLPIKQLTHTDGALVALWVTNREKLRNFVEQELFPAWGIVYAASLYWLKVKPDASLISDLDLFHHRPYESLVLGYCHGKHSGFMPIKNDKIIVSIPGDYSRKPPVRDLLLEHIPGCRPARCVELFSREMLAGCTSWGNEPLHFQGSDYFVNTVKLGVEQVEGEATVTVLSQLEQLKQYYLRWSFKRIQCVMAYKKRWL